MVTRAQAALPLALDWGGRRVRLKWHKLRQAPQEPPFARANLQAGLAGGASLEVDLRHLACGRFVCLHDSALESETAGNGPVAGMDAAGIAALTMLDGSGVPGAEPPLLLDELAAILRTGPVAPAALVQLDLHATAAEIDEPTRTAFAETLHGLGPRCILSGHDWAAVARLGEVVPGLALGYDPSNEAGRRDLLDVVRDTAPDADTIYLDRRIVRASEAKGQGLVARLRARGHRVDCWTIDHGRPEADGDLRAALAAGCDQITTNTARAWDMWAAKRGAG
jgi:glycerophosphoryl diester phosphodiesterase